MALPLRTLNIQLDVSPVDVVDPVTDEMLAKFFVDSHLKSQAKGATLDAKSFTDSRDTNRATIWPHNSSRVAKQVCNVFPKLQDADLDKLTEVYAESLHGRGIPIAVRHIKSMISMMIRMSEAHAKMHLS
ncbi:hypothetical protein T459_11506 [Capsicum annuum]|uniref:DNA helicase n=1 Tax=Capsicum annuum TaxID=4072 RepID=A0A2G2ZM65_CAPAN|nr:hypothetical protein T459_11506 [Capsicum annuum]